MLEVFRDPVWQGIGVLIAILIPLLGWLSFHFRASRKQIRDEREYIRRLLRFLESSRLVAGTENTWGGGIATTNIEGEWNNLYGAALDIRARLRQAVEELPENSKAVGPVRDMHEVLIQFLNFLEEESPEQMRSGESGREYVRRIWNEIRRLEYMLDRSMDKLREEYGISSLYG